MRASGVQGTRVWRAVLGAVFGLFSLAGQFAWAEEIGDKTLVAWVSPANLDQRGGGVLTLEKSGGVFDAIVLGELAPGRWMAGSNGFARTSQDQASWAAETAAGGKPVPVAIVYRGNEVTIFRDGVEYATYTAGGAERFDDQSVVLMGLRHRGGDRGGRFFAGSIEEARIYGVALDAAQVAALEPNEASEPAPLAWWDFEGGRATDRMGRFATTTLVGDARLEGGKLVLPAHGAYLIAERQVASPVMDVSLADATARALREKLLSDPYRPGYHFVTPEGRCMPFDPNGAIFWKGRYHLFYIFQDARGHNWGHVSSSDLFHWRHHPTGLVTGMFSGNCFLNKEGVPTMCYHQVDQGNAMAVALDDDLNTWKKLDTNPITPRTEPGDPFHDRYRSWDPFGWLEGETYYAIFGGNRPGVVKARDLGGPWTYVGDLMANRVEGVGIDEDVSCADFFKLGDTHMLLCISHRLGARYYLGDWKDGAFHPRFHEKMSWVDNSYFAPESLLDEKGRRIMWAWIFDAPEFGSRMEYGWSGTMALPRVLTLDADGRLNMNPPEEIERLRYNHRERADLVVEAGKDLPLPGVEGNSLEIRATMTARQAGRYGIKVACSPQSEEETVIYFDVAEKKLKVDTTRSSLGDSPKTIEAGPLELKPDEPLELRVFVDKSVVEVFANGRQAVMRRVYPSRADSVGVRLFSDGGPARVSRLDAWDMDPANPY